MNLSCQDVVNTSFDTIHCETRQQVATVNPKVNYVVTCGGPFWSKEFSDTSEFLSRQKLLDNEIGITWTKLLDVLTMIDVSECNPYTDINSFVFRFNDIRNQKPYRHTFFLMKGEDKDIRGVLLFGLSQIPYEVILPEEEKFVMEQLHDSDSDVQGWALNAIQCWDNVSNLQAMTDVDATNKYIQDEIDDFVVEHRR